MAIPKMVSAVNRTLKPLDAMYDGQPVVLVPGYLQIDEEKDGKPTGRKQVIGAGPGGAVKVNPLPYFAAEMVKRQNPIMGTEDPENPRDFESLIGIVEWGDDIDYCEQSSAEERLDRSLMDDTAQKAVNVMTRSGRKAKRLKKKRRGLKNMVDESLKSPMGIRADY